MGVNYLKDVTQDYIYMIESFECDFDLALTSNDYSVLKQLPDLVFNKNDILVKDIDLLKKLSFGLRHNQIKIVELK